MNRTFLLRLAAAAAAGVTVLPALPAAAVGGPPEGLGRPSAPPVRGLELACPADRVTGGGFADAAGSVHAAAIDCLAFYGVTKGGADGTFGAGRAVTRAQMGTFLVRVLEEADVELPAAPADAFSDDDGSAHEGSLDALAELGIVNGAGDGTVSPDAPVRRDQMASFLVRLIEEVTGEELDEGVAARIEDFFDDTDGSVHRGPINALAGLGIAAGRSKGIFDPSNEVKREQMATFLMRLIDRLVEKGDVRVPASLTLSAEEVLPGDVVTGTVVGDGITSVTLRGCGFDDVVATQVDTETFEFQLTVPDAWPAEQEPVDEEEPAEDDAEEPVDGGMTIAARSEVEVEDDCEFQVLVTFADGDTEELEGELEFRDADELEEEAEEESDEDDTEDENEDEDSTEDEDDDSAADEPVASEPTV